MSASFRIGRIAGIPIGANWSWLVVFGLVIWSLAENVFPDQDPGLSDGAYWGMGAAAALLFFGSILLHELGHALQARRDGVEIEGITLWLFGGVARFRGSFPSAGAEFRIAVAGPAVSAAIAGALLLFAWLAPLPEPVDGVAFWVGYINAVVLVFNLIPALPLDGGRILHAALWHRRGLVWATKVGAGIGQGFGMLMIGGGVAAVLFGGGIGGVWLIFVGWFLNMAARAEAQATLARERLGGRRVGDVMVRNPVVVAPDLTIGEALDDVIYRHRHSAYPVVEGARPVGLLPFRCVVQTPRAEWDERRVRDCMLPLGEQVPEVAEDDAAGDAFQRLAQAGAGRALVVADGRLVGLLTFADLARAAQLDGR